MKKINKLCLAAVVVSSMGASSAMAANKAADVFLWHGTVPMKSISSGFVVTDATGQAWSTDNKAGLLVFKHDGDKVALKSSSRLNFNVYTEKAGSPGVPDAPAQSYSYMLTSFQVGSSGQTGGLAQEQGTNGFYKLVSDGNDISKNTDTAVASGGTTALQIVQDVSVSNYSNPPLDGDDIEVQAAIVITNAS